MKIVFVHITNAEPETGQWWEKVASRPDEPLIEARIDMVLSHKEYHELLEKDRIDQGMSLYDYQVP